MDPTTFLWICNRVHSEAMYRLVLFRDPDTPHEDYLAAVDWANARNEQSNRAAIHAGWVVDRGANAHLGMGPGWMQWSGALDVLDRVMDGVSV